MITIGDRVVVRTTRGNRPVAYAGLVVGESRDGKAWIVRRDEYPRYPTGYHKSFCELEEEKK